MEPRRLHSLQTIFLKTVFPVVWIGGFAAATLGFFLSSGMTDASGAPAPPWMKWLFLTITVVGGGLIYWSCVRLKLVRMDAQTLYISNLLTEIRVPLSEVELVTENRWINTHPVTIHLRSDTEFGRRIVFMPKVRWFAFWSEHPVVEEILVAARAARGDAG